MRDRKTWDKSFGTSAPSGRTAPKDTTVDYGNDLIFGSFITPVNTALQEVIDPLADFSGLRRSCLPVHHVIVGLPSRSAIAGPGG